MKAGGYVAIGLGASSAAMKIHETCRAGRVEECRQVKFVEGGRLLGNVAGGAVASAIGVTVAEGTCLAIGAGTYGVGGMVCMLVVSGMLASQMGDSGGQAGEYFGEKLYEVTE